MPPLELEVYPRSEHRCSIMESLSPAPSAFTEADIKGERRELTLAEIIASSVREAGHQAQVLHTPSHSFLVSRSGTLHLASLDPLWSCIPLGIGRDSHFCKV